MIEGIILSLAFLGVVFLIIYSFLQIFYCERSTVCFFYITDRMTKTDICNLVFGIYLKSIICGDCILNNIYLVNMLTERNLIEYFLTFSEELRNVKVVSVDEINDLLI